MRRDARNKLRGAEGLCDIVIRAEAETSYLVYLVLLCGDHEHGALLVLAYLAADLEAVNTREHDIEDNEVIVRADGLVESVFSVEFYLDGVAVRFEIVSLELGYVFFVLDYKNFFAHFYPSLLFYFALGISIITLSPPSPLSSARMEAPWRPVICFVIESPRPLPFFGPVLALSPL